ncbi:unnamed protein product, partial [Protopolystoma xenopodis]
MRIKHPNTAKTCCQIDTSNDHHPAQNRDDFIGKATRTNQPIKAVKGKILKSTLAKDTVSNHLLHRLPEEELPLARAANRFMTQFSAWSSHVKSWVPVESACENPSSNIDSNECESTSREANNTTRHTTCGENIAILHTESELADKSSSLQVSLASRLPNPQNSLIDTGSCDLLTMSHVYPIVPDPIMALAPPYVGDPNLRVHHHHHDSHTHRYQDYPSHSGSHDQVKSKRPGNPNDMSIQASSTSHLNLISVQSSSTDAVVPLDSISLSKAEEIPTSKGQLVLESSEFLESGEELDDEPIDEEDEDIG